MECNAANVERTRQRRQWKRDTILLQRTAVAHERVGDISHDQHLYDEAAQHYRYALNSPIIRHNDRLRIKEKLAATFFLGGNTQASTVLLEGLSSEYLEHPVQAGKAVETLLKTADRLAFSLKFQETFKLTSEAIAIAQKTGNAQLIKNATIAMAERCILFGRVGDAIPFLNVIGPAKDIASPQLRFRYYKLLARAAALKGDAPAAYRELEYCVRALPGSADPVVVAAFWEAYCEIALVFGDIALAKSCIERELFVARQNRIAILTVSACLHYADILSSIGDSRSAREYLLDALAFRLRVPSLDGLFVSYGLPLALRLKDEELLRKCIRPSAIRRAFASEHALRISTVSTAFAKLYVHQGNPRKAQLLLHRALALAHHPESSFDLLLEIANHGESADIATARKILGERAAMPNARVAQAFLSLFDACRAKREQQPEIITSSSREAERRFSNVGWYGYALTARALIQREPRQVSAMHAVGSPAKHSLLDLQDALTLREQEVVQLVLKGHNNRSIAEKLAITERTVETHMTSILKHLGIRSRHQLTNILEGDAF